MTRAFVRLLLTAAVVGTVACQTDQITLGEGANSQLNVRVYVDANGTGAFESGEDTPVASAAVTARGSGAEVSSSTDESGLATLQLPPGTYTLSVSADVPAGAILATASAPIVVASFQGGSLSAEFRYANLPGGISGVVFRDDDGSGAYEPGGLDTPAPGVELTVLSGAGSALGTDTTDNNGAFTFDVLRPGDYTLEITPFAGLTFVGGESQMVTVGAATPTSFDIEYTGDLTPIDIVSARGMDGATVLVEGVVTWQQEWDATVYFFQDATGGISTFDTNDPPLQRGDRIRIRGVVGSFRGETQLSPVLSISVLGQEAIPTPQTVTASQVNAGQFQGELVRLSGTVDSLQVFSFDNHMVFLTDGFGNTVTAYVDSRNGIASTDWTVGEMVVVAGVLGSDDRNSLPFRIELRDTGDRTVLTPPITIASARGMAGATVTVEGVVTWQQEWDTRSFYYQDATGGINTFDTNAPPLQRGDRIRIRGVVGAFRGETQLSSIVSIAVLGQEALPAPRSVTGAEINAGQFQGELASIDGTVDSLQVFSFDNHTVFFSDGGGTTFTAYVDSRNGIASADWTVGQMVTVQGVLATDDRNALAPRLELRDPSDMISGPPPITIASARGMAGATVTVEGVVTWQQEWDTRSFYYQDATGGINTFDTNAPPLQRGDRIRIRGEVGAFRGETQLSSIVSIAVLGQEALPAPRSVTGAEINAGQFQGELASIDGTVDSLQVFSFDNHTVFFSDGGGTTFTAYVDSRNGIASADWTVGQMVTVQGVLATDDRNALAPRLELRDPSDMQ